MSPARKHRADAPSEVNIPTIAGRAQAYLFAIAGLVGALGVLLPHPPRFNETAMLLIQIGSVLTAGLLFAFPSRVPRWFTASGPFAATMLTSAALAFSGSSTTPYLLFYLWVAFYAFYFLPRRHALALAIFSILNYAAVIVGFRLWGTAVEGSQPHEDVAAMVLMGGTVLVAAAFIMLLRGRVERLIGQLREAATTDPLTGLLNRRGFHRAIDTELARARRSGQPVSLLLGDCDHFKQVNDRLGHTAGDDVLVAVGRMLEGERRLTDVAARIGGEEFALMLSGTDPHEAFLVAERIRVRFAELFGDHPVAVTLSVGVATYPSHAEGANELLRAADDALYAAKALGRDRSVMHSAEIEGILSAGRDGEHARSQAQLATVLNLAEALDMRDSGTARHSQTVGRYCELMAVRLGLARDCVDRIRIAGVLHDIGKIGVADSILSKPGPLTDEEFDAMRKHPEIGARILGGSGLHDVRQWILAHHERPDGRGYPFGLAGDDIPLEARILAVADAYEAMTSDRVYRKAIGPEAARSELIAGTGSQFDLEVVAAFLEALRARDVTGAPALELHSSPS